MNNHEDKNDLVDKLNEFPDEKVAADNDITNTEENNVYPEEQKDNIGNNEQVKNGVLDIVYGVLFDPVRTFNGFVQKPPVGAAIVIFIAINLAEAFMGLFITPRYINEAAFPPMPGIERVTEALLPLFSAGGFIYGLIKWFIMAGLLHLLAEFMGGKGKARGVFAVYGVAGIPAIFMIPVNILFFATQAGGTMTTFLTGVLSLGLFVWSVVLLIIGMREVHGFSTGSATITVLLPGFTILIVLFAIIMYLGASISSLPKQVFY